jgi:hypothetical protein
MRHVSARFVFVICGLFVLGMGNPVVGLAQTDVLVVEGTSVGILNATPADVARLSVFNVGPDPRTVVLSVVSASNGVVLATKTVTLAPGTGDHVDFVAPTGPAAIMGVVQLNRTDAALPASLQLLETTGRVRVAAAAVQIKSRR